jgi:predicted RNase H-like nuclease (RuvC/YqgF family)
LGNGVAQEVKAITEAMVRLLAGTPLRSDGQLTIKSHAAEAGLKRNKLTHKHTGMKDLFYALAKAQDSRPVIAEKLQQENDELKKKVRDLQDERRKLREAAKQFARVVHVLEVENQQLREHSQPRDTVRPLPGRRRPQPVR